MKCPKCRNPRAKYKVKKGEEEREDFTIVCPNCGELKE